VPSNLRPTTRKCLHLLTRGHFRSRDKDSGLTIRSAMALCFIEPELWPLEVLQYGNRNFRPFCSCDLDLDPMTLIYEADQYSLEIYWMCQYELPTSRLSKVIV